MGSLRSWWMKPRQPDRRSAQRVRSPWLVAFQFGSAKSKRHRIRDISATGLYLLTEERWQPGEMISIALQRKDQVEVNPHYGIPVQVRAIRWGRDGVALSFVQAKDMDLSLHLNPLTNAPDFKEPAEVRQKFRMAKASAFVERICPSISGEAKILFRDRLGSVRIDNALNIALMAESLLAKTLNVGKKHAHPQIVMSILETGSWAEEEATHQLWAGLLASCCAEDLCSESSPEFRDDLKFIRLLRDLAPDHARIFEAACAKARLALAGSSSVSLQPVLFTRKELLNITGMRHQFYRIYGNIDHLEAFGLLKVRLRPGTFSFSATAEATPTILGLELYARCHGYRGELQAFYGLDEARSPVA